MSGECWSCSRFADWLRGTPKPPSGSPEEWNAWEKQAKVKKIRYWLAEEGLDHLEDFICWPLNRIRHVRYYINNRWVLKKHALTSNLGRGQWHDFDGRLLHAAFDELVNFVEIEEAWMLVVCSEEECKKYRTPWYRTFLRIGVWRCPEAGVARLEWAAGLKHDEEWGDKNDPRYGQPTPQALGAQEILSLYKWWKTERPKRPDPMDASGWSDYCEERRQADEARGETSFWSSFSSTNEEDEERSRKILDHCHQMEKEQDEEDTDMLIRLVKVRHSLWT